MGKTVPGGDPGRFRSETRGLVRSWMRHDAAVLRDYLVQGVEDPRLNVQSILTRHFLIGRLFPGRFDALMDEELRFGLVMNWLRRLATGPGGAERFEEALFGLLEGQGAAEAAAVPRYVSDVFARLPTEADGCAVPDYLGDLALLAAREPGDAEVPGTLLDTFQTVWRAALNRESPRHATVVEPACGSANDYRFLDRFGVARHLDYVGFDLCEKNVRNARSMFPGVRFEVGDVLAIGAPDGAFDYGFVHDLFEHLSVEAMEAAVAEVCRVTRRAVAVGFFNMHAGARHVVCRVGDYHVNSLSVARAVALFRRHASAVEVIHIDAFLRSRFGCPDTHNRGAYTLIVVR